MTVLTCPVAVFVALISTPGISAPVASDTAPEIVAVVCPNACGDTSKTMASVRNTVAFLITPPSRNSYQRPVKWNQKQQDRRLYHRQDESDFQQILRIEI